MSALSQEDAPGAERSGERVIDEGAMVAPGEPTPEVVFADAVEGLFFKGLGARVTPALRGELKALGLDLETRLLPAYSRKVWNAAIALAAARTWPQLDVGEAHVQLGRTFIDGYRQTLMGKALTGMARMLGPLRTLGRMGRNLRTGGSYNETTLTQDGPALVRFWINEPYLDPGYVKGLLQGTLEACGARSSSVEVIAVDAQGASYRVRWEA